MAYLGKLRGGRWWLVEGFSGLRKLSPLCKVEGPSENMGSVEYGLEGNLICYERFIYVSIQYKWTWDISSIVYWLCTSSLPFCSTVNTQAYEEINTEAHY